MNPPALARRYASAVTACASGRAGAIAGHVETAMLAAIAHERPEARATLASLQLDLSGEAAPGAALALTVWIERATRTLAFVSAEVRVGDLRIAAASAVFDLGQVSLPS